MKTITNPVCPASRVGMRVPVERGRAMLPFFVEDGTITVTWRKGETAPSWATPAERAARTAVLVAQRLPAPPYAITEDTTIVGGNFHQLTPHTEVFTVSPGVRFVISGDGQFQNVSLPDEAEVVGFPNLQHALPAPTGLNGPEDRKAVALLCECVKCCTAQGELEDLRGKTHAEEVALGTRLPDGRRVHAHPTLGGLKERFRQRRLDAAKVSADRTRQAAANLAALRRHNPTETIRTNLQTALGRGT